MSYQIDPALLTRIDGLQLSARNRQWRAEMKAAGWFLSADRERWTVQSWKETEGEDLELRRAKLLACVLDHLTIAIHPYDEIVGRPTTQVIGCQTSFDVCGDYIPGIWDDSGSFSATLDASVSIDKNGLEVLRESARTFRGKTMPEMTYKAWEALVGNWAKDAEAAKLKDPSMDAAITGQSTSILSWKKILRVGLKGYIAECEEQLRLAKERHETDIRKFYFWEASIIVLNGVIRHAKRYAALADQLASEAEGEEQQHYRRIAETCRYVPEHPARTLREALQSMQFCNLAKMLENPIQNNCHWGRADQYLYPFFLSDLRAGIPLEEEASLLADLIGRWGTQTMVSAGTQKESHQINFGINNVMLGGLGQDGTDQSNELSYLFLHLIALLQLSSPTVGLRWNRQTPEWLMQKAIRTNLATRGGIPLFENDDSMIASFVRDGIPYAEAVEWCGLGCVYPTIPSRAEHYGAEGVAAINLAGILHMTLHNGRDIHGKQTGLQTGEAVDFADFEALYAAFLAQHKALCHRVMWLGAVARDMGGEYLRLPLLSILGMEASMTLGQDLMFPHPEFSLYGISDRAIIDTADSLLALKKLVFDTHTLSMAEMMQILDSDFAGERGEHIRRLCLKQPKYGNDDGEIDALVHRISEDSAAIIHSYNNAPFRNYIISREGLAWHYYGGLGVGALPNGRKALEPLNDGSLSPMRGADINGPTAVLRSACNSGFPDVAYASVLNQKFSASLVKSPDSMDKLIAYTNAFLGAGGTHIQYNLLDTEQLKDAKLHPQDYPDLIVRIGGFSAYFVQLSPEIQDDVIYRSEFEL